ncbi:M13 family peptidase [Duganella sp. FT80W]|uniref:M13 family peptidase n=1 Tax=Duganella guangzhouensis TaxID=2666084 RepID=A0A6I2KV33_9BURK|nr:M13 family metallopeptidase [Duganella guangzhouensis]MRW89561.1 M13 family peptidase [Duganella guangzhouensis]
MSTSRLAALLIPFLFSLTPAVAGPIVSGIYANDLDRSVRAQDDFYRYAVGGWVARVESPAWMPGWDTNRELQLNVYQAINDDLKNMRVQPSLKPVERKLADLYASYMDESGIDSRGLAPLQRYLDAIDRIHNPADVARVLGQMSAYGLDVGMGVWVHPDDQDPSRYLADFVQADLGLPGRDYYLSDEPRFSSVRAAYLRHIERVLALAGSADPGADAKAVVDLETSLAQAQWTETATRVPGATSHRFSRAQLADIAPGLDLRTYSDALGIPAEAQYFNLSQPSFYAAYGDQLTTTPLPVWQAYLRLRLLDYVARMLPAPFRNEADRFFSMELRGATASRPRWIRAVGFVDDTMGDALGQIYVDKHFPPAAEQHAHAILDNVVAAFRQRINKSTWLSAASRKGALEKLDHLVIRMGSSRQVRDYANLTTSASDPAGNWLRARGWQVARDMEKMLKPVNRDEWSMTPQAVNGYYSVSRNQVVLPAALIQPPYFQADADDAANYGALGWFIAHELSHAFDRAGSRYDGEGRRVEWMTPTDRTEFERRAQVIVAQYSQYAIAPGKFLNGELSVGENIADITGLSVAYDAYHLSLRGRKAPKLDGLSGDQRFFLAFGRIWAAEKINSDKRINEALADTHAPESFRVFGAVRNNDAFYKAFNVKPSDAVFLPKQARIQIW